METENERDNRRRHKRGFSGFMLFTAYLAAFFASFGITVLIYRITGQPPEIFKHLLTGLIAVFLVLIGWRFILKFGGGTRHHNDILNSHDTLTGTLAQIAQGNFDILLDPKKVGFFNDLALAINDMAKSLGTIETMRQDFISNVSHEIQSPLTSIGGFAALLQKDGLTSEERKRYAAVIESESKRLSNLSDNLLKLSSLDNNKMPLNKKKFRLDKQLEQVALTLEPQWAAKSLTLEVDFQKVTVCGDEDLLSRVWVNLIHNAIKFTPENGTITISLSEDGETTAVKFTDTGVGIAPGDQIHIFERFYKADKARDRSFGGNGLGLSIVKKIVELHSGSITVESEISKGTVFTILLKREETNTSRYGFAE